MKDDQCSRPLLLVHNYIISTQFVWLSHSHEKEENQARKSKINLTADEIRFNFWFDIFFLFSWFNIKFRNRVLYIFTAYSHTFLI